MCTKLSSDLFKTTRSILNCVKTFAKSLSLLAQMPSKTGNNYLTCLLTYTKCFHCHKWIFYTFNVISLEIFQERGHGSKFFSFSEQALCVSLTSPYPHTTTCLPPNMTSVVLFRLRTETQLFHWQPGIYSDCVEQRGGGHDCPATIKM